MKRGSACLGPVDLRDAVWFHLVDHVTQENAVFQRDPQVLFVGERGFSNLQLRIELKKPLRLPSTLQLSSAR